MKRVTILGSTGSIGTAALKVIEQFPDQFEVVALAAGSQVDILSEQIRRFKPRIAGIFDTGSYHALKSEFPSVEIVGGENGIREIASFGGSDFILSSIVGSAGLLPTVDSIKTGKTIGLANKESLVMAGEYVNSLAREYKAEIIPVDSEHSAIFQCLNGKERSSVRNLILTASGGPFAERRKEEMNNIEVIDALKHPNWSMGKKITIDSATLMNKGLEVIEAHYLFNFEPQCIKVLIHPQSIVHSMVEFVDGGILAQLSNPDMCGPIAYALSYPDRLSDVVAPCLLSEIGTLSFMESDSEKFPCLRLAYEALDERGTMPAVLNAANEVAVDAFLNEEIPFGVIPAIIEQVMSKHRPLSNPSLPDILEQDRWARSKAVETIEGLS